jgi:7-cyano-7-deazaguanine synthase
LEDVSTTALLLSGGMDSIAIAHWKRPSFAVTIDYGQRPAEAEIRAAAAACHDLNIGHTIIRTDLSALGSGDMAGSPALAVASVPEWWPFRNQMLVTLAAMAMLPRGVRELMIGTLKTDAAHADGTEEFVFVLDALLKAQEGEMTLVAPAIAMTAVELVRVSGAPMELLAWAHSCHVSNYACGDCRGCRKHYETMAALGVDPY